MGSPGAVFLDYKFSLDYCCSELSTHETTSRALDAIHDYGVRIEMRKTCWRNLTGSLTNTLELFVYLRDQATELLLDHDLGESLDIFKNSILTERNLTSNQGITLNQDHMPNVRELREAVEEMGLREFRGYADTQQKICSQGQSRLDLMIDRRYERGGQDANLFEASIKQVIDDDYAVDILVDAYIWGTEFEGFLLTRHGSEIYSNKKKIKDCMSSPRYDILSPREVTSYLA